MLASFQPLLKKLSGFSVIYEEKKKNNSFESEHYGSSW